jgi:hypothetical protein
LAWQASSIQYNESTCLAMLTETYWKPQLLDTRLKLRSCNSESRKFAYNLMVKRQLLILRLILNRESRRGEP